MSYAPPVITARFASHSRLATVALVVAGAALTAAVSQLRIPMWPVPITGSTFGVLLAGAALGWRRGAVSQLLYLAAGVAGAPVFTGGGEGFGTIAAATGGYLLAYPLAAGLVGYLAERRHDRRFLTTAGAFVAGSLVVYLGGVTGLVGWNGMELSEALRVGVLPFLVGDTIKAAAAGIILPGAWRLTRR